MEIKAIELSSLKLHLFSLFIIILYIMFIIIIVGGRGRGERMRPV